MTIHAFPQKSFTYDQAGTAPSTERTFATKNIAATGARHGARSQLHATTKLPPCGVKTCRFYTLNELTKKQKRQGRRVRWNQLSLTGKVCSARHRLTFRRRALNPDGWNGREGQSSGKRKPRIHAELKQLDYHGGLGRKRRGQVSVLKLSSIVARDREWTGGRYVVSTTGCAWSCPVVELRISGDSFASVERQMCAWRCVRCFVSLSVSLSLSLSLCVCAIAMSPLLQHATHSRGHAALAAPQLSSELWTSQLRPVTRTLSIVKRL